MLKTEIAELMNKDGQMFDIAQKITYNRNLSAEEKEVSEVCDAWVKEIASNGNDKDCEIASFIRRTVNDEIYNAPDELLDRMFDRGNIGEFDDYEVTKTPKNTLEAHDAVIGGNVDKSYIDFEILKPTWKHAQVEFELPYVEMRRNGFKSVATLTNYAVEALRNKQFYDIFNAVDLAITGGEQAIAETGSSPSLASWDAFSLYLLDRDSAPVAITLSKYAQALGRMSGATEYRSEAMKDDFNRYGLVKFNDGINIASISGAKKLVGGEKLLPDKKIFGVAGKIGTLDQKGDIRVYETMDNNAEKVDVKIAGFEYGYCINDIENLAKITMAK